MRKFIASTIWAIAGGIVAPMVVPMMFPSIDVSAGWKVLAGCGVACLIATALYIPDMVHWWRHRGRTPVLQPDMPLHKAVDYIVHDSVANVRKRQFSTQGHIEHNDALKIIGEALIARRLAIWGYRSLQNFAYPFEDHIRNITEDESDYWKYMRLDPLVCFGETKTRSQTMNIPQTQNHLPPYTGLRVNREQVMQVWPRKPWWNRRPDIFRPKADVTQMWVSQEIDNRIVKNSCVCTAICISPSEGMRKLRVSFKKAVFYVEQDVGGSKETFNYHPRETGGFHEVPWEAPGHQVMRVDFYWPGWDSQEVSPNLTQPYKWKLAQIEARLERRWFRRVWLKPIEGDFSYSPPEPAKDTE